MIEQKIANWIMIKNVKNKLGIPFKQAKFVIQYGKGTDDSLPLFQLLVKKGIIEKSGSWYTYKAQNEKLSFKEQGEKATVAKLKQPEVQADLQLLMSDHGITSVQDGTPVPEDQQDTIDSIEV